MAQFTVLGATGFIGGHLVRHLRSLDHLVFAPGRGDRLIYSQPLGHVIYAIGVTADFRTRSFETMEAHVSVLGEILRHTRLESLTYLSSTRIYSGAMSTDENEDLRVNPADPGDLYNLSKLAGEALCLAQSSKAIRIARLSNVYGNKSHGSPADIHNFLESVIYDAIFNRRVVLRTTLASAKDYVAVDDICQALTRIALSGTERLYNVAAGQNISHAQLTQALTALTGCSIEVAPKAQKIEFPTIDTTRLLRLFTTVGENWSPASLLDQLPYLTSDLEPAPMNAAGGIT